MMNKLILLLVLFVLCAGTLFSQSIVITGKVTSATDGGGVFYGVTVQVKGTTVGTSTDVEGNYTLNVPKGSTTLVFSFVGMKKQEVEIAGRSVIDVVMEPDLLGLDEVVVTALGISREKKGLGYSVTDIKGESLVDAKESNIVNMFQGKLAGVQITNNSGAVGSSSQMLIRGVRSFGDNEALWVVDGTPISNMTDGANPWGGVDYGNAAADIDPENIESVSILKGANSAALYGSRARNGVILITTKKGSNTKGISGSYSNITMVNRLSYLPTYQNEYGQGWDGSEYTWKQQTAPGMPAAGMSYQDWAANNSFKYVDGLGSGVYDWACAAWGPRMDAGLVIDQFQGKAQPWISHPDNVRSFFVTGLSESNNLTLTGVLDKIMARFSYTNIYETGIIPNTDQKKNLLNASTTINIAKNIKFNLNLNYVVTANDNLGVQGFYLDNWDNPMVNLEGLFGRQVDMKLLKEHWQEWMPNGYPYNWCSAATENPYWAVNRNTSGRNRGRFFGNAELNYHPTSWLDLTGRYGIDYFNEYRKNVVYEGSFTKPVGTGGAFSQNQIDFKEINADFLAIAHKKFLDFGIVATLGANYRQNDYKRNSQSADELIVSNLFHISNVKGTPGVGFYESHFKTNSVYGSINTSFRDYLYLDATFRNDWSSTLPKNNRSYFYPSVSLSWLFTETFRLEKSFLSYGKIRASYAMVGSDTNPYYLKHTYTASASFTDLGQYNYSFTIPAENQSLKPEFSNSFEIGTELKFFLNRIGLDISYFDTKTRNQIFSPDISPSTGFSSKILNAGEIESRGLEILLAAEIINNPKGLNWSTIINWSTQRSQVNTLYKGIDTYILNSSLPWFSPLTIEARPGQKYGNIYGSGFQRDESGRVLIRMDGEMDGYPLLTTENIYLGNIMPDWIASISNEFTFRNFTLNILIDGRKGGDMFSITKQLSDAGGTSEYTVRDGIRENGLVVDGINMVTNLPNDIVIDPQWYYNAYCFTLSEPAVIDGSFIKLREVVLGYRIPLKTSIIRNVSVSIIGHNLALLYRSGSNNIRIDPETAYGSGALAYGIESFQAPPYRSIGFRFRCDF